MRRSARRGGDTRWAWFALVVLAAGLILAGGWLVRAVSAPTSQRVASAWPTRGWETALPEEQGLDSVKLAEALETIRQRSLHIHSLLVIRNGYLVADAIYYPYDGQTPHNLASVTKSFMTTLIGIAADQGKLSLNQPVLSFFPERTVANRDDRKERMTVAHLASMSSGMECLGTPDYPDEPTLAGMEASGDWVQFALDLPMATEPGTTWAYCSPGSHLLSAILTRATGLSALAFARQHLFEPLGIGEVLWPQDAQGYSHGWGDLYLYPRDAAKLGYLWLRQGVWDGRPVVAQRWVEDSAKPHTRTPGTDDYGYGWWLPRGSPFGEVAADGRGGQRIGIFPALNVVVVTTGGGFTPGEATDLLGPALVDPRQPLPPNPAGVTRLQQTLASLAQAPAPQPVPPLPLIARAISGRTYTFEGNPLEVQTLRLDFTVPGDPTLRLTQLDGQVTRDSTIGLDGVYRMSRGMYGFPVGQRGYWEDERTFVFEYDQIANIDPFVLRARFEGDTVVLEGKDRTREAGVRAVGRATGG